MEFISSKTHLGEDRIGLLHHPGEGGGYLFLNGRETALEDDLPLPQTLYAFLTEHDAQCTFFDYGGWGKSGDDRGKFQLARWLQNSLDVLDFTTKNNQPQVLIGYSLGAYLALAIALLRPTQVAGIVALAPSLAAYIKETGHTFVPNAEDKPLYNIHLTEDTFQHVDFKDKISVNIPIRLLHGTADKAASHHNSLSWLDHVQSDDMTLTLIKGAGHFFKRDEDLEAVCSAFV